MQINKMESNNYSLVSNIIFRICKPKVFLRLKAMKIEKALINDSLHVSKVT